MIVKEEEYFSEDEINQLLEAIDTDGGRYEYYDADEKHSVKKNTVMTQDRVNSLYRSNEKCPNTNNDNAENEIFDETEFVERPDEELKAEFNEELNKLTEKIRANPNDARAYFNRGNKYAYAGAGYGSYDNGIADYTEALRLNPNYIQAYNNRATAYADKGDYDKAIADYNEALRINPNYKLAEKNRTEVYAKKNQAGQGE